MIKVVTFTEAQLNFLIERIGEELKGLKEEFGEDDLITQKWLNFVEGVYKKLNTKQG